MNIELDLTQSATRAKLLEELLVLMTPEQHERYDAILKAAAIPDQHHHSIADVNETIDNLAVDDKLKAQLRGVYAILAQAEATVHGCAVEETHFHEVGNASGIRNALAICTAFFVLDPDHVSSTPIQTGSGKVNCAHGIMDIPAPATAAILQGLPIASPLLEGELCTPTSAAIIKYYVQEFVD
ncbi:nickel insertion protein [Anaerotardibacter muris]|uniref:nickel insertion protein n=1 Tax=Anaerotardibacter muris TaxID=2941505 RepID=UPI00203DDD73|nr:nickel insertion protein [Anaerotardibacter muris]